MDFVSLVPVLLPIALFVVTLIIIFSLRASDKSKHNVGKLRKLYENYKSDAEASDSSLKQFAVELEQKIARKNDEVQALIQKLDLQLVELKEYSEDLVKLKNAMDTYKTALEGLSKLTEDADDKVAAVQADANRLDSVRSVIEGFRQDMRDADEHLRKHEQRVIQLERESVTRMNEAVSETDNSMDEAMASLHKESQEVLTDFRDKTNKDTQQRLKKIDDAFQSVIHTVQQFFGELQHKLDVVQAESEKLSGLIEKGGKLVGFDEKQQVKPSFPIIQRVEEPEVSEKTSVSEAPAVFEELSVVEEPATSSKYEVEITDIDYDLDAQPDSQDEGQEELSEELQEEKKNEHWETYGEEEVVEFDDEPSN
jgi:DNA repair ATPase RecN